MATFDLKRAKEVNRPLVFVTIILLIRFFSSFSCVVSVCVLRELIKVVKWRAKKSHHFRHYFVYIAMCTGVPGAGGRSGWLAV